jgi:hypothetical protein
MVVFTFLATVNYIGGWGLKLRLGEVVLIQNSSSSMTMGEWLDDACAFSVRDLRVSLVLANALSHAS